MSAVARIGTFRQKLRAHQLQVGTFLKTPNAAVMEILGHSGLDCACVDAEHAPFDRASLDAVLLAGRAHDLPSLVRVAKADSSHILNALDLGATGVVVPHVISVATAQEVASMCRYGPDGRGYTGSTRAAAYTTRPMTEVIADANASVCVIAQIEDAAALEHIDDIAAVDGLDCLFIGRMDLSVSLGAASPGDTVVVEAVRQVCAAGRRHNRSVGMFTPTIQEAAQWRNEGATFFLLESDQQWILRGARELAAALRQ